MIVRKGLESIEGGERENRLIERGQERFLNAAERLYLQN